VRIRNREWIKVDGQWLMVNLDPFVPPSFSFASFFFRLDSMESKGTEKKGKKHSKEKTDGG